MQSARPLLPINPGSAAQVSATAPQALANLVQHSGLFYESHLAQWVAGSRSLMAMIREPQAMLGQRPMPGGNPPADAARSGTGPTGAPPHHPAAAATAIDVLPVLPPPGARVPPIVAADALLTELDVPASAPQAADSPDAPAGAAAGQRGDTAAAPARADVPTQNAEPPRPRQLAAQAYAAAADDSNTGGATRDFGVHGASSGSHVASSASDTAPAPLHPATEATVRQQLELLATQQFRWAGEAWPGVPMQWDIAERRDEGQPSGDPQAAGTWSSRLVLEFPQLGQIEARLTLTPHGLETRLIAPDSLSARRLDDGRERLQQSLDARGIALLAFAVANGGVAGEPA